MSRTRCLALAFLLSFPVFPVIAQEIRVTLPAVASVHGVPPTYFHSDVWVFNGSSREEATVTATYRCAQASCGNAVQTFTLLPRHARLFPDIVASLFGAPETYGAVEFESRELIVVTSRLYTPDRSAPTFGMFVPGLKVDDAHASLVLTSLAHSAAFRTNVGVYNPNDGAQLVRITFHEASGAFLGQLFESVGPRRPLQINDGDIFRRLGLDREVRDFYAVVSGDGRPLHAYAAVIDGRSQDLVFIRGEDAAGLRVAKVTLPAVASIPGAAGTFFRSDVRIWNASPTDTAEVTVRFSCFRADCGERRFTVAPRQMLGFDDIVSSLFLLPQNAGAMEFVSVQPLVVTSRLYTPSVDSPTVGMSVPGLPPRKASPAVVLNGLSHPAGPSTGSRVNVGVFNQADVAQLVTYRLFDASGNRLGQTVRLFAAREVFQVNDVFAFLEVEEAVEAAYCLVEGSEELPLFAYAAILDNRSQDPIFVPGEDDPEKPPITPLD